MITKHYRLLSNNLAKLDETVANTDVDVNTFFDLMEEALEKYFENTIENICYWPY